MVSKTTLLFNHFILFALCLQTTQQSKSIPLTRYDLPLPDPILPTRNLKATSSGVVPIVWPVYAVNADFVDQSDIIGGKNSDQMDGLMGIALYTNESFFGGNCRNFLKYKCREPDCYLNKDDFKNVTFPYYNMQGYGLHTQLFMDYDFFSSTYMGLIYAEKIEPEYTASSSVIYGMIGLGLEGYSFNNFVGSYPIFSIYLDNSGRTGTLIFDCASDKINKTGYNHIAESTKNWEIEYEGVHLNETFVDFNGTIVFDLNLPFVGLPAEVYSYLLELLREKYNVICYDPSVYLLGCVYDGNYLNLPPIDIGGQLIIPPQVYLHIISAKDNIFNLMLFPLSLDESDPSVIQIMPGYENHIIIGSPFLQHFYVCFQAKPNTYQINIHEKIENDDYNFDLLQLIGFGLAIAVPILTCSCFCILSIIKKKSEKASKLSDAKEHLISISTETKESKIVLNGSKASIDDEKVVAFEKLVTRESPGLKENTFSFAGMSSSALLKTQKSE